jgi:hypothetical protein
VVAGSRWGWSREWLSDAELENNMWLQSGLMLDVAVSLAHFLHSATIGLAPH